MDRFLCHNLAYGRCRLFRPTLAFFWVAGLLLGAHFSFVVDSNIFYVLILSNSRGTSFLIFTVLQILFLLCSMWVLQASNIALLPFALLKSFLFAFTTAGIAGSLSSSSWLFAALMMFDGLAVMTVYWWIWLAVSFLNAHSVKKDFFCASAMIILVNGIDYFLVMPFLRDIL